MESEETSSAGNPRHINSNYNDPTEFLISIPLFLRCSRYGGKNKCDRNLRRRERKCDVYSGNKIQYNNKYRQKYLIVYM